MCRPINSITYNEFRYIITFLEFKPKYLEIKILRNKHKAYTTAFLEYKSKNENNSNNKCISIFATNNGGEFVNNCKIYYIRIYYMYPGGISVNVSPNVISCLLENRLRLYPLDDPQSSWPFFKGRLHGTIQRRTSETYWNSG